MPKRKDIKSVLVIGSGPIVIGQAAEFDYAGTQACLALKDEGYKVILANSNPATIMTDSLVADIVYMEPLTLEYITKIIAKEKPDALLATMGGQTSLNLSMQLHQSKVLEKHQVKIIGTNFTSINQAEDRSLFKKLCVTIKEPILPSQTASSVKQALLVVKKIHFPVIVRPAFTLGGTGGGFAYNDQELKKVVKNALTLSPVKQVLIEKSILGYKEIEYEVMRDYNDNAIVVCNMENIDPVGVHTGDSMVVAPSQTLTNKEYQMLRNAALKIVRKLKIVGGCNIQFALDPFSMKYFIIEVNPRVSRSSALASKATGYPIAKVATKLALGYLLDEIKLTSTTAAFEPALDYVVTKIACFPFDKFALVNRSLSTQMKATGEVMAIGSNFKESFLKAIHSLENNTNHLYHPKYKNLTKNDLLQLIKKPSDERIYQIAQLLRLGVKLEIIYQQTAIDLWFLHQFQEIIDLEVKLSVNKESIELLKKAKSWGYSDECLSHLWKMPLQKIYQLRKKHGIIPVYKMIDTCAAEFKSYVPYFFSTYLQENESLRSKQKSIIVLGSGPIRIGQGIEFDYSTVHCVQILQQLGYEAIVINNNPETVSTDYEMSNKLYFGPLDIEHVMEIIDLEKPEGVIVQFGGQTALNLTNKLVQRGVKILGTEHLAIARAENRETFTKILKRQKISQPDGETVSNHEQAMQVASRIGYPILVRPSFVLGGRAMQVVYSQEQLKKYWIEIVKLNNYPVLIDKYVYGKELEVDAIFDGNNVLVVGIMEHIEKTGVHSGDSMLVYPSFSITQSVKKQVLEYTYQLGKAIGIKGIFNIQFIVDENQQVHVIEVNPRASRTAPFISKITKVDIVKIATRVILGQSFQKQKVMPGIYPEPKTWYVKCPVFSSSKIKGIDCLLSPEMKSTGEVIGYDQNLYKAIYKAFVAANIKMVKQGRVFISIGDEFKIKSLEVAKILNHMNFRMYATRGTHYFLAKHGIKTNLLTKISEGSHEIIDYLKANFFDYVINMKSKDNTTQQDGYKIRQVAIENNTTIFTSLETITLLLRVLDQKNFTISNIN